MVTCSLTAVTFAINIIKCKTGPAGAMRETAQSPAAQSGRGVLGGSGLRTRLWESGFTGGRLTLQGPAPCPECPQAVTKPGCPLVCHQDAGWAAAATRTHAALGAGYSRRDPRGDVPRGPCVLDAPGDQTETCSRGSAIIDSLCPLNAAVTWQRNHKGDSKHGHTLHDGKRSDTLPPLVRFPSLVCTCAVRKRRRGSFCGAVAVSATAGRGLGVGGQHSGKTDTHCLEATPPASLPRPRGVQSLSI